ncbi:hypothetical protein F5Y00DRAFT_224860 [Daldinia vernicosa]|uniref:uncharacterized protein n=1 Tax=Daldinia vernicosa TaxID=114800 RepID=UPI00200802FC|nr:uncharacterized protein F5Y00DRAFT_224860 [Daldinia vernicosa]KAI0853515.1 hypothetical protein F5Y00DRAFT_224860 [Daldinia vernicosa]
MNEKLLLLLSKISELYYMDTNPHHLSYSLILIAIIFSPSLSQRYTRNSWALLQVGWLYTLGDCRLGEGPEMARYDYSPEWENELEGNIDFELYEGMNDEMQRIVQMAGDNATLAYELISQEMQNKKDQGLVHEQTYSHGMFREPMIAYQMPRKISVDEVRRFAEPMVAHIWKNFYELQSIAERYEASIQERWENKSEAERRDALNQAWGLSPPMALEHRPDLTHLKHQCTGLVCNEGNITNVSKRPHFLWPNINLEDLSKTEPFLLLLNARGRNPPSTFAFAELEPLVFGIKSGSLRIPPFLNGWNMKFTGRDGPDTYGELVSWEDDPDARQRLQRRRDVSPGEGLWILEIQDRLYRFLLDACKIILHDLDLEDRQSRVEPKPPVSIAKYKGDVATSLIFSQYESIYLVPAKFDIGRLQNLVGAKLSQVEDTLWALREDPGFFASSLLELYHHRPEHILDVNGNIYPSVATEEGREEVLVSTVRSMLSYYLPVAETWYLVCLLVNRLAAVKENLFDPIEADAWPEEEDLLLDVEVAFRSLRHHLDHFLKELLPAVNRWARWSPPIQPLYRLNVPEGPDAKLSITTGPTEPNPIEAVYLWVLHMMADPANLKNIGVNSCVQEVERIAHDPEGRKFFTPFVAEQFSDIFVMAESIRQIGLFQPWAATFETTPIKDESARREISDEFKLTAKNLGPMYNFELPSSAAKLGAILTRMKYPIDEPLNETNVEAMRAAEKSLDAFWDEVATQVRQAELRIKLVHNVLTKKPKRTRPWAEPSNNIGGDTAGKVDSSYSSQAKMQQQLPPLEVDSRAKKVFAALFYVPSTTKPSPREEIPWEDFLYAMHHVGFEIEELGGSNWHFTPGPALLDRGWVHTPAIQFREPGPGGKITRLMARVNGRRLARSYGWSGEMFTVTGEDGGE